MVYRPISEYAIIGNDSRIALVDADGSIDWCCFPTVSDPSVFARLLDAENGGHFALRPTATYESEQAYLDTTNVLRTTFETDAGRVTLTDFMPIAGEQRPDRYQQTLFRHVRCDSGIVSLEVDFKPRLDYARPETVVRKEDRSIVARVDGSESDRQNECLNLQATSPIELVLRGDRATGNTVLEEGDSLWFTLQYDHFRPMPPTKCRREKIKTVDYWTSWVDTIDETARTVAGDQGWFEEIIRSALVLKLLIHEDTGAIYAAPTTSLPESYGGERNWDYRYNWIRDAKFVVQALYNLGATDEAKRYFEWFRSISHEGPEQIQPLYSVRGERNLTEETLDHLSGYRYSGPVRIGNAASEQRQLDMYGTIIQGLYETQLHEDCISSEDWESIRTLVDYVCEVWDEKDAGIWEFRGEPRHYVHSKLLCWVALDCGIRLADCHERDIDISNWKEQRAQIREAIETRGYSEPAGSFMQHFETDETLDAACLLIPIYEFLPPDDPRVEATIDTVMAELMTEQKLVHRTKGRDTPGEGRGTFLFCTFWLVDALVLADRVDEAREIFETVLGHLQTPSLLPERIDPETGEFFGNYPQAFSHLGLVNSAIYLNSALGEQELTHDPQEEGDLQPIFRS